MSTAISQDRTIEEAARDGSIDIEEWPRVLESVLQKLHTIVHNDFPLPQLPLPVTASPTLDPEVVASTPPQPVANNAEQRGSDVVLPDAGDNELPPSSQHSTKENDAPTGIAAIKLPVPEFDGPSTPQPTRRSDKNTIARPLPSDLLSSYQASVRLLESDFAHSPPYTIQRLAELVLHPKKQYRYLPAYLRALDRVVSVSSPVSDFPLPVGSASTSGGFLTNGDVSQANGIQEREGLGSDESLGGALLTPIPWLRNGSTSLAVQPAHQSEGEFHSERMDTILGPNGAGSVETVTVTVNGIPSASSAAHTSPHTSTPASPTLSEQSDASTNSSGSMSTDAQLRELGGVTQGELLRQEQEAGVVPVAQTGSRRSMLSSSGASTAGQNEVDETGSATTSTKPIDEPLEESPHARGPDIIGMEDTGLVQHSDGLDMEAAVGRGRSKSPQPPPAETTGGADVDPASMPTQNLEDKVEKLKDAAADEGSKDADGDVAVTDADASRTNLKAEHG